MSERKVNVAIVGLGFGAEFIPIYQAHPHAQVHANCRRNQEQLNKVGDALCIDNRYTDYGELLADPEVDFIQFYSPIPDHARQAIAAIKAGKHVMCTELTATTRHSEMRGPTYQQRT